MGAGQTIDVYLIGGQSNATGQGYMKNLPEGFKIDTRVLLYNSGRPHLNSGAEPNTWVPLRQASESPDRFGPELGFGNRISELYPDRPLALIKHAHSGTSLSRDWNPGSDARDTAHFGPQFAVFVATVEGGLKGLRDLGYTPVIRGMIWHQGENDAGGNQATDNYGGNLAHFIARVREQFHVPAMPFIYADILTSDKVTNYRGRTAIRQTLRDIDQNSGSVLAVKGAYEVRTDDLGYRAQDAGMTPSLANDWVHIGTRGQLEMGKRMADAIKDPPTKPTIADGAARLGEAEPTVLLFAFFRNERDGLHLATSEDGLKWEALNADKSFLTPQVGGKLMRDPTLQRGPEGLFHLLWTDSWTGQSIGYANSKDLIHWSEQQELPVMAAESTTRMTWAPEMRYDGQKAEWVIYWSSTVGGTTGQRTYATTTKDFKAFTPAKLFFDPGFGEIDASILEDGGKFLMFYKHGGRGIQLATADNLQGPYTNTETMFAYPNADQWEGPWPIKRGGDYLVYVDHYRSANRMGLWRSHDLKTWEDITAQTSGLRGISHGSVIPVPKSVVAAIKAATAAAAVGTPNSTPSP